MHCKDLVPLHTCCHFYADASSAHVIRHARDIVSNRSIDRHQPALYGCQPKGEGTCKSECNRC